MTKKIKITLIVSIAIVLIATTVTVGCYSTDDFDKYDPQTWCAPTRNGGIDDELADQIEVGMTLSEIIELIGRPQEDIGSGVVVMEWKLKSGGKLIVSFNPEDNDNYLKNPSHSRSADNWVAFYIKIKSE